LGIFPPLVIVDQLNVYGTRAGPFEADPVLIIDPNVVLPGPVTPELLEFVSGRNRKVTDPLSCVQIGQLSPRNLLNLWPEFAGHKSVPDPFGIGVLEGGIAQH
jgi:hypothetical protein